jgi:hypothetical protein
MLGKVQTPKTKQDLVKSIQAIPRMEFEVIELTTARDKPNLTRTLDRRLSKGSLSVILIQEK